MFLGADELLRSIHPDLLEPRHKVVEISDKSINKLHGFCISGDLAAVICYVRNISDSPKIHLFYSNETRALVKIAEQYAMSIFIDNRGSLQHFLIPNDEHMAHLHEFADIIREHCHILSDSTGSYNNHSIISSGVKIPVHSLIKDMDFAAKACYSSTHPDATAMTIKDFKTLLHSTADGSFTTDDLDMTLLAQTGSLFDGL